MAARLTRDDVAKVAHLARLTLSDEELDLFTDQLGQILGHADDIAALKLDGVEATAHPFGLVNVVRSDEVRASLSRDEVLAMAPDAREGRFAVPRILGEAP
ncbi:MAG TPA: Asp-tRNA(Asn)/Glu-tRNA(Gln) amidotransferase subunit GatC [Acidimicrobiales bacterium]|nr:MAG: aspartyl/glutamyl-tRNA(Asn/Gln) amidotransferase subunit C [Actinobacteria bacterium 21-64-8]HQT99192.1 Asp-tRNA(Asn)/Glu-tRNA(Gln) amidotransferase subunit GatC [Acidimicrobiales bacterium]